MKTSHTPGNWTTNGGSALVIPPIENKKALVIDVRRNLSFPATDEDFANAKLISCAPEMLDALIKANDELKSIIAILDGRITNDFAKTDLGMRLTSFLKSNAFICEEKIEPIIEKATK